MGDEYQEFLAGEYFRANMDKTRRRADSRLLLGNAYSPEVTEWVVTQADP